MDEVGIHLFFRTDNFAVVGASEVIKLIPLLYSTLKRIINIIQEHKPDAIILVDYPGFNLRLAQAIKNINKDIPLFYYFPPILWGRRGKRGTKVAKVIDYVLATLPQEANLYRQQGAQVTFVGHPLLDMVMPSEQKIEEMITKYKINPEYPLVALLPGSRSQEIKTLLPEMIRAAILLKREIKNIQFIIPLASSEDKYLVEKIYSTYKEPDLNITITTNLTYETLSISKLVITASGTATLESALLQKPMIIVYKVSKITEFLARFVLKEKIIGLPNIIAGKKISPELLQEEAKDVRITKQSLKLLTDQETYEAQKKELAKIKERLGEKGAGDRAAKFILNKISLYQGELN